MGWLLWYLAAAVAVASGSERTQHQVQHGPCSYTFILPEVEQCRPAGDFQVTNSLQQDTPTPQKSAHAEPTWQERKLESLESATENNTQWLQKLESYIQENVRSEMERNVIHTQTATMLEMGTNLLSQSAETTRKLTDVETQVLNQTSRLEIQLLEYSLSTYRLEKQLLEQTQEVSRLSERNSYLEHRLAAMDARHSSKLQAIQQEKQHLLDQLDRQSHLVNLLEGELASSTRNSTLLQRQLAKLTDTVQQLLAMVSHCNDISASSEKEMVKFRDCAEIFKSGVTESGIYNIHLPNSTQKTKVFCDMKTRGGGWTVFQHRLDGSVDFHRGWKDYKLGFGDPSGEHWLGNDVLHLLTTSKDYSLQVHLKDAEGHQAYSNYGHFYIDGEEKKYSIHVSGFSGTAGRTSSLTRSGTMFSTKDQDNDQCSCKCAQMATGGWWFEACGPSNLNGIYYSGNSNVVRYNSMKWYYWKGPSWIAAVTTMMIRPVDF
ncbi:angiopoietin-2b isoform X1 [Triplophysa rosa]|uniref:Angiopoietin 2 n=1 Tax=Triplophysa rosa TaxID=992332 RepID=A0A9W7TH51_TRIRA|nr:angiopoietin-2b isoform X1 [Triplophysa rosa]XP_057210776.1 angiopoietin-2b isoform X1 [Triplophysa rosa]KAI7798655.1 Angiopoietin 2 [Triplophysa rosa]